MFKFEQEIFENLLKLYSRTVASFEDDVTIVREWVKMQPHFPEVMNDDRIKNFLLLNKCSIERTKKKIDNYYTLRPLIPEFHGNPKSDELQRAMEIGYWLVLPKLAKVMYRVPLIKLRKPELIGQLEPCPFLSQAFHVQEIRLKEDRMFKDIVIADMEGLTWSYILKMTPPLLAKFIAICEKIYSNRIESIWVINRFTGIQQMISIVKPFLKQKILDKIRICEDASLLFEELPKEMIPSDYGGEEKSVEELSVMMKKKFDEYQCRFDELDEMRVDEKLRPEDLKNDEVLGFYGNFKKLELD